jgi:hypothetical protein
MLLTLNIKYRREKVMKLKTVLEIMKALGKTIPVDMSEEYQYYSDSKEEWVDILELDVIHAIRIIRKIGA